MSGGAFFGVPDDAEQDAAFEESKGPSTMYEWNFFFQSKPGDDAEQCLEAEIRHQELQGSVAEAALEQYEAAMDFVRAEVSNLATLGCQVRVHAHGSQGAEDAPARTLSVDVKAC